MSHLWQGRHFPTDSSNSSPINRLRHSLCQSPHDLTHLKTNTLWTHQEMYLINISNISQSNQISNQDWPSWHHFFSFMSLFVIDISYLSSYTLKFIHTLFNVARFSSFWKLNIILLYLSTSSTATLKETRFCSLCTYIKAKNKVIQEIVVWVLCCGIMLLYTLKICHSY